MSNTKTVTIPCTSVRIDPATGEFVTNRNSSITLKVAESEDGSVACEVVREANRT